MLMHNPWSGTPCPQVLPKIDLALFQPIHSVVVLESVLERNAMWNTPTMYPAKNTQKKSQFILTIMSYMTDYLQQMQLMHES